MQRRKKADPGFDHRRPVGIILTQSISSVQIGLGRKKRRRILCCGAKKFLDTRKPPIKMFVGYGNSHGFRQCTLKAQEEVKDETV